jgi:polyhydroxybutyrate depolymerase
MIERLFRVLSIPAILGLFFVILCADQTLGGTLHTRNTITAPDGRVRYFHYYVPQNMKSSSPVVILLHGGTQDYSRILRPNSAQSEWLQLADEKGFLVLIPNGIDPTNGDPDGTNQHWNDCRADAGTYETGADDVGFVRSLVDWAVPKFHLDRNRVYATGASNGGMMVYRLAFELSGKIAAIAAFVANLPANSECSGPVNPIPVFICNGTEDPLMPWNGGHVGKGGNVISAFATRNFWIGFNRTGSNPAQTKRYTNLDPADGSTVKSDLYTKGNDGSEVLFYTVTGGGHSMPSMDHKIGAVIEWLLGKQNHDIESVRHAWSFLSRQTLGSNRVR